MGPAITADPCSWNCNRLTNFMDTGPGHTKDWAHKGFFPSGKTRFPLREKFLCVPIFYGTVVKTGAAHKGICDKFLCVRRFSPQGKMDFPTGKNPLEWSLPRTARRRTCTEPQSKRRQKASKAAGRSHKGQKHVLECNSGCCHCEADAALLWSKPSMYTM